MRSTTILFGTPLWRTNLLPALGEASNAEIARAIRQAFFRAKTARPSSAQASRYLHEGANREEVDPLASAANNEWFQHQLDNLAATSTDDEKVSGMNLQLACLSRSPAFASLTQLIRDSTQTYLQEALALTPTDASALVSSRCMLLWSSVHAGGSAHPFHTHRDALLSGAYMLTCPKGSGDFVAGQPTSGEECRIAAKPGTLLIFPSNMSHRVAPSKCEQPRISVSFNLEGHWAEIPSARVHLGELGRPAGARTATIEAVTEANRRGQRAAVSACSHGWATAAAAAAKKAPAEETVTEREAATDFAAMAQRLMMDPSRKRPQGMPERRKR